MAQPVTVAVDVSKRFTTCTDAIDAIEKNSINLDDAIQAIKAFNIPIAGIFQSFRRRAMLCSVEEDGPEQLVRMKVFLYDRCFDILRRKKDTDHMMLMEWTRRGVVGKKLWGVAVKANDNMGTYMRGVAALSNADLPIDVKRMILAYTVT